MSLNLKNAFEWVPAKEQGGLNGVHVVMAFIAFTLVTLIGSNAWLA